MSRIRDKKTVAVYAVLLLALVIACGVSLFTGAVPFAAEDLWRSGIFRLRLARTALAVVAGAGLSATGVIFQSILRNPLAEPYVLGVSLGAGLGAALAIVTGLSTAGVWTLPAAAFVGTGHNLVCLYAGPNLRWNLASPYPPVVGRRRQRSVGKPSHVRGIGRPFGEIARCLLVALGQPSVVRLGTALLRLGNRRSRARVDRAFCPRLGSHGSGGRAGSTPGPGCGTFKEGVLLAGLRDDGGHGCHVRHHRLRGIDRSPYPKIAHWA